MRKYPTLWIEAINVDEDHIHMQIEIAPSVAVCDAVQRMKQYSSLHLKKKFKFIKEMYLEGNIWSVGCYSSTIGLNEKQIRKYIEYQDQQELPQDQPHLEFS